MKALTSIKKFFTGNTKPDRILITGYPKTGTTVVYHSIRVRLPEGSICQFEPELRQMPFPEDNDLPVLVKSFIPYSVEYDSFNKKVLIVRDPRDTFISNLLYKPYNYVLGKIKGNEADTLEVIDTFLGLLKKKEQHPGSVSVRELHQLFEDQEFRVLDGKMIEYYQEHKRIFILRYEDFIDGHTRKLEKYLGLEIARDPEIQEKRVIRSKSYGNWKDWFTSEDVEYYHPKFKEFMDVFGYKDDWTLNESPSIDPSVSSEYVNRIVNEAKELWERK